MLSEQGGKGIVGQGRLAIKIEWNGYRIWVWAIAYRKLSDGYICEFETMREVKQYIKENYPHLDDVTYAYIAAEEIDEEGNVNPPCYGKTKAEALNKLKKVLTV